MISQSNYMTYDAMIAQQVAQLQAFQKTEVLDFVNFLLSKPSVVNKIDKSKISFEWEGALKKTFKDMNSVDLQHNIRE